MVHSSFSLLKSKMVKPSNLIQGTSNFIRFYSRMPPKVLTSLITIPLCKYVGPTKASCGHASFRISGRALACKEAVMHFCCALGKEFKEALTSMGMWRNPKRSRHTLFNSFFSNYVILNDIKKYNYNSNKTRIVRLTIFNYVGTTSYLLTNSVIIQKPFFVA